MAETHVHMGNCGMRTIIRAQVDENEQVQIQIESECPTIQALAESLPSLSVFDIGRTIFSSPIYQLANERIKHVACAVPAAILRTVEVAAGFALPDETHIWARR